MNKFYTKLNNRFAVWPLVMRLSVFAQMVFQVALMAAFTLLWNANAFAVPIVYTDRAAWSAHVTGATTLDFSTLYENGPVIGDTQKFDQGRSLNFDDVTFQSSSLWLRGQYSDLFYNPDLCLGTGTCLWGGTSGTRAYFASRPALPAIPVNAIGVDFGVCCRLPAPGVTRHISLSSGESYTFEIPYRGGDGTTPNGAGYFFGIVTDDPIDWIEFDGAVVLDNFSYRIADVHEPADVPEPGVLALLSLGLFGIIATHRKRN